MAYQHSDSAPCAVVSPTPGPQEHPLNVSTATLPSETDGSPAEPADPSCTPLPSKDAGADSEASTSSLAHDHPSHEAAPQGLFTDSIVKTLLEKLLENTEQIRQMQVT